MKVKITALAASLAILAVCGPFGASKEQASGLYAMTMAERGFVTLAFDPSFTGESSGEPRRTALNSSSSLGQATVTSMMAATPSSKARVSPGTVSLGTNSKISSLPI